MWKRLASLVVAVSLLFAPTAQAQLGTSNGGLQINHFLAQNGGNAAPGAPPNFGMGLYSGLAPGSISLGAGGSGYAQSDSVTLTCAGCVFTTNPIATVNQVSGSAVTGFTITNPGVITTFPKNTNPITFTQSSTSGGGSGATLTGSLGPIAAGISSAGLGTGGSITNGNFFIGAEQPDPNLGGAENTFVGDKAGAKITAASSSNTCVGHNACGDSGAGPWTNWSANTMTGADAGRNATGNALSGNSFYGSSSGRNTASNSNTFYGFNAGVNVTTGGANTIISGNNGVGATLTTGQHEVLIADDAASPGESDTLRIAGAILCRFTFTSNGTCQFSGAQIYPAQSWGLGNISGQPTNFAVQGYDTNTDSAYLWSVAANKGSFKPMTFNASSFTFGNGGVVLAAATPTVAASQIGYGNTTAAVANCGAAVLTTASACLVINVAGTTRYVPYF